MAYEHKRDQLAPRKVFVARVLTNALCAGLLTVVSLAIGVVGYHATADLGWIDATLNASMILTGMGPVAPLPNDGAKLFATGYALFSGLVYVSSAAILLAPVAHRFMHRMHIEYDD